MPKKNKKQAKQGRSSAISLNPIQRINLLLKDRHPVFKFLLGFIGCMVLFYLFYYSSLYKNFLELPFLHLQANIGNALLHLLGHDTQVAGTSIASKDFSVDVKNGCDGLEAIAILVSGILIFPASFKLKMPGLLWGVGTLLVLNLLRIAALYLIGLNFSKEVFEIAHIQGGFIVFTMISVLLLFVWINWATNKNVN
ncbi:MAG: archaeosortase/exosortase family protein [Lewinellaceae bacterium]|nr:archaeosortase/exosortase family protein [Saprospiraceae bacterium]MCB9336918.1 archaeosortase/exosortase family protein [Lewinellaceae bacterium]